MSIIQKPSPALVYDLINEGNPTLPFPVSALNMSVGVPSVVAASGGNIQNTQVQLSAKPNSDYIGRRTVKYRRYDLATMFRGVTVQINKYSPALPGATGTVMFTVHQLLADINAKYGMNLTTDDLVDQNITRGTTQEGGRYTRTITVAAKATSLGYVGSFPLKWVEAPQSIEGLILTTDLPGRLYPGGNVFDGNHKVVGDCATFSIDWSDFVAANGWSSSGTGFAETTIVSASGVTAFYNAVFAQIEALYPGVFNLATGWATGHRHAGYVLTPGVVNPACPEANNADFNRVLVLTFSGQTAHTGKFYFHYNV